MRPVRTLVAGLVLLSPALATAQAPQRATLENFTRAETDRYFATYVGQGALGRFLHVREVTALDRQDVVRMNRDTLYSAAILDLDAGPATIVLPEPNGRFVSLLAIDQDHFVPGVFYAPTRQTFTRQGVGTRYMAVLIRTFVNPNDAADIAAAHALQDAMRIEQAGPGRWEGPAWDQASLTGLRTALEALAPYGAFTRSFGARGQVDPVAHLVGTAAGWGGNPASAATYLPIFPPPGTPGAFRMRLANVPVDGFWSITVYDARGFMVPNPRNAVSLNNVTAAPSADGAVTVQFGACADTTPNCLPTPDGWNAVLRLYRPRAEILDGRWSAPPLEPLR